MALFPLLAAKRRAVSPLLFWAFTCAPAFNKACTVSLWPCLEANIKAVFPWSSTAFTLAPA